MMPAAVTGHRYPRTPTLECAHTRMEGKVNWPSMHAVIDTCLDCGNTFAEPAIGPVPEDLQYLLED